MKQLLDIAADQFYVIGISTPGPLYSVVKNTMHNVYPRPFAWTYPEPGRQQHRAILFRYGAMSGQR